MNYFVSPATKTDLIIDPTQLATHLKSQWCEVEIRSIKNPQRQYSLEWIIPMEGRNLEGALEKTGQAVILNGDVSDCAKFSLWLRSLIDPKYPLFFYDEDYRLLIVSYTQRGDLIRLISARQVTRAEQEAYEEG